MTHQIPDPTILLWFVFAISLSINLTLIGTIIYHTLKNKNNVKDKKEKDLYPPTRRLPLIGNRKLNAKQQKELFTINSQNLQTLKNSWKNEHL